MGLLNQFRGLPRQVYLLSIVRMIMAMGTFVFSFISLLASSKYGLNEFQIGNVMMFVAAANIAGSLLGGKLADTFGRKRMFLAADAFAVTLICTAGLCSDHVIALVFLVLSYAGSSMAIPILAAMITDISGEENRTECFSLLYLTQNIGFAIGPSVGGLLFYHYMKLAFYGQGLLYLISGIWMFFAVKDRYVPGVRAGKRSNRENEGGEGSEERVDIGKLQDRRSRESLFAALRKCPIVAAFVVGLVILTACYQEISFILPLQFGELFGIESASRYGGFIWSVNAVVCVVCTPLLISIFKRRNQLLNLAFAAFLYAVGFSLNGIVHQIPLFYAAVVVWTSGEILISTGAGVFIANHAPETHRARFQSLYEVARGFGRGIGPNVFGFYLLSHSYGQTWGVISLICLVGVVYLLVLYRVDQKMERGGN